MQKAIKWLNAKKLEYTFHNYKEAGIDKGTLELWLKYFPVDKLINLKSTTYRSLTDTEKESIRSKQKAIALMMKYPSLIKRPVWQLADDKFFLGWDEAALNKLV